MPQCAPKSEDWGEAVTRRWFLRLYSDGSERFLCNINILVGVVCAEGAAQDCVICVLCQSLSGHADLGGLNGDGSQKSRIISIV